MLEIGIHGKVETVLSERMQQYARRRWAEMPPLCSLGSHLRVLQSKPSALVPLAEVARQCGPGGTACEIGPSSALNLGWLAQRGIQTTGLLLEASVQEKARQAIHWLGGAADFTVADPFALYSAEAPRYNVLFHQDLAAALPAPWLRSFLAQQVALADRVVFSVPSIFAAETEEYDALGCRLLSLEAWQHLLEPFDVLALRLFGDDANSKDRVLVVLRGQPVTPQLQRLMTVGPEPYPFGISVIIHSRQEAHQIAECIRTTLDWSDQVLVCDMDSDDGTPEIAEKCGAQVIRHIPLSNFDRSRNFSAEYALYRYIVFIDADERVPEGLGPRLRHLLATQGHMFEALVLPFRHHFAGKELTCLYPGYKAPSIYKNGTFFYNARPHQGARIDGRIAYFRADDPNLALPHFSYTDMSHYLKKMDGYTSSEAANQFADGRPFQWQAMLAHAVRDMRAYYDGNGAFRDGPHGLFYTLLSGFYRIVEHGKLWEKRYHSHTAHPAESAVPQSLEQMLEFALAVCRERPPVPAVLLPTTAAPAKIALFGPIDDPSGYGEEVRNTSFALTLAGVLIAARSISWGNDQAILEGEEAERVQALCARALAPGFIQIVQNLIPVLNRHPEAKFAIARTMFETDRLPADYVRILNRFDRILVPSEFNRETFRLSGVAAEKLVVVPGCFDPAPYLTPYEPTALTQDLKSSGRFTFLSVYDWTLHKGWDVSLTAFLTAFEGREDVQLVLKVWSTNGYTPEQIIAQAATHVKDTLGIDLSTDTRIRFVTDRLSRADLLALYKASDAFVLPSRGEGWGRPYMEAMAVGLPTIGTNWSGNTAFMTAENSYLLDYKLVPVPERGYREIPGYKGHRWAEPDIDHLVQTLRNIVEHPEEAKARGAVAREQVCARFNREVVGKQMAEILDNITASLSVSDTPRQEACACQSDVAVPDTCPDASQTAEAPQAILAASREKRRGKKKKNRRDNLPAQNSAPATMPSTALTLPSADAGAPAESELIRVVWEGAQRTRHSLGLTNRYLCRSLLQSGRVELCIIPTEPEEMAIDEEPDLELLAAREFTKLSGPAQITVRHFFPPCEGFPREGLLVLVQPWEFGYLPKKWVAIIATYVHEVWCYSRSVYDVYLHSGVPAEKLQIVPLGVDTEVFNPEAPPYVFTDEPGAHRLRPGRSPFVFLFVGGTLHRKGIDILIDAYFKAFSTFDNVVLVIKDTCTQTVYRYDNQRARLLELANDPTRPPILYLDNDLSPARLAGLYTASDCLAAPYRGEGFCLPALESLACGRPVIVPEGGPTDDFVDAEVGWRLPAERRELPSNTIGEWECVDTPWMLEVSSDDLARQMREIVQNPEEAKRRGQAGAERVKASWTWDHAAAKAIERLQAIRDSLDAQNWLAQQHIGPVSSVGAGPIINPTCPGHPQGGAPTIRRPQEVAPTHSPTVFRANPNCGSGLVIEDVNHAVVTNGSDTEAETLSEVETDSTELENKAEAQEAGNVRATAQEANSQKGTQLPSVLPLFRPRLVSASAPAPLSVTRYVANPQAISLPGTSPATSHQRPVTALFLPATSHQQPATFLISLCMIVRDEERVLPACLESVVSYGFEIIIIDTGSKDRTKEIALRYGARVYERAWNDNFAEARNESLKYATGKFILWLDADDTLTPEAGAAILRAAATAPAHIVGFVIPVQFVDDNGVPNGTRVDHVKLFRNLPGVKFEGRIHEQILGSLRATGGEIARCDAVVLHSGYDTSPEGQAKKRERDARILALELAERPDHPFVLFCLGMTDHYGEQHETAVKWLRHCLQVADPADSIVRKTYALLALSLRALGRHDESFQTVKDGLAVTPDDPELHFHLAQMLTTRGDYAGAKQHYLQALAADIDAHFSSVDMGILSYKSHHNLAGVCQMLGDYAEAKQWWLTAMESSPDFGPSRNDLFHASLQALDFATSRQMLALTQKALGECIETWWMTAQLAQATGDAETAERCLRQVVGADPQAVAPRLALGRQLLQTERMEEAVPHLHLLTESGVAEAAFFRGVVCVRRNDLEGALGWMEKALTLNPGHPETMEQIECLKRVMAE